MNARRIRILVGAAACLLVALGVLLLAGSGKQTVTAGQTQLPSWPESNTLVHVAGGGSAPRASLTVKFRPSLSSAQQRKLLARMGAVETGSVPQLGLQVVSIAAAKATSLLKRLRNTHAVETATPDDVRQIALLLPACTWFSCSCCGVGVAGMHKADDSSVLLIDSWMTSR